MGVPALLLLFCLWEEVLGFCAFWASHKGRPDSENLLFIFLKSVPWSVQGCASSPNPATLSWLLISVCCLKKLTHAIYGGLHLSNLGDASNKDTWRVEGVFIGHLWGSPGEAIIWIFCIGFLVESVIRISLLRSMCYLLWTF